MRPALMLGVGAALLFFANRPLHAADACVTPQGTLCRTIRWETIGWEIRNWGFYAFKGKYELAYRRDGAWSERFSRHSLTHDSGLDGSFNRNYIRLPGRNETIIFDNATREYSSRPGVLGGTSAWDLPDPDCAKLASAFALSHLRRIGEVVIAGVRSIEYTGKRSSTHRVTVALAPSLGCTQMRNLDREYNLLGFPISSFRLEVVSALIGEPEPSLFQIPEGYHPAKR